MANQKGVLKLKGRAGDYVFYQGKDGLAARKRESALEGDRIRTDIKFRRTMENATEFGRAGKAGKLLRKALALVMARIADGRVTSRLTTAMLQVVKSDGMNDRGMRTPDGGDLSQLIGFEFNKTASLTQTLLAPFTSHIERASSMASVNVTPLVPAVMLRSTEGATHYRFIAALVSVNFEMETHRFVSNTENVLPITNEEVPEVSIDLVLPPGVGNEPMFLVFGIEFLQVINGKQYALSNSSNNALTLLQVDQVAV